MLDIFKEAAANQFDAALCTLDACIDQCPATAWQARVGNLAFCQVAFHVLFYTDLYLGLDEASFRGQPFHRRNQLFFGDYEELEDRPPQSRYEKDPSKSYLQHCRGKAAEAIASETAESLGARCGFERLAFSRAELYLNNLRHIQHHAAQLSLRLRLDAGQQIAWVKSGWRA